MSSETPPAVDAHTEVPSEPQPLPEVPAIEVDSSKQQASDDSPEPQSPLTERFTEVEWTAIKAFRGELPDVFAHAYPDDPNAKISPVTLWGVKIDPTSPKDARVSVVLLKFLRARNLSVSEAREMLRNTLRWRELFDLNAAMKEEFPEELFGGLGGIHGHDKEGRPIVYNLYGGGQDLKAVFSDVQRFIRWRVVQMEKCVTLLDFTEVDQTLQIHDYDGLGLSSRDANSKNAASEVTNIFQSHYPELLYKKFFINVPTIMNWIFWAFKPLISANTLAKLSVVGSGHHAIKKALLPFIDGKQLPKRYGGEGDDF
ncbi:uncharacterized protein LACBIDRAFT_305410 [Laccaria bicolor S238N-H82]|uniref:Phosphatidylinositol transfer protein SFH5 n=1 Tax=Laccaria bicolor (strain S238N-H82 / ATCC MYA-4686) TaxID=486041 RepID=B0CU58_LACBS|nr:uncharacterized protein LACBIDRAFT_305410 [Laccaria bicolor S238N-H82]EDR14613.1 predicted protein [Laccaria bicolor S238N-H82]|eukprot:XP_001875172.1 predicted protein [Laccaria bicolor S238N-H82]